MTGLAVALLLVPAAYRFDVGTTHNYDVNVQFDGYLPVLGGNEGVVEVKMGVKVNGKKPETEGISAVSELTAFDLTFNSAPLPLTLENAVEYFPRTTIQATPLGKITKSDAPNVALPVRLPGLDVKRFPDITYLPLELPKDGVSQDTAWTFSKDFEGSPLKYDCRVKSITGDSVVVDVKVSQKYDTLENEAMEIVKDHAKAVRKVSTTMTGSGQVTFDLKAGAVSSVAMVNDSTSSTEMLKTGLKGTRKLKTTVSVKRHGVAPANTAPSAPNKPAANPTFASRVGQMWNGVVDTTKSLWTKAMGYWTLLKIAMISGPGGGVLSKGIADQGQTVPPLNFTDWLRKIAG